MNMSVDSTAIRRVLTSILCLMLAACSSLRPAETAPLTLYSLDSPKVLSQPAPDHAPTLLVNPPLAAPGFDSQHIVYTRVAHQLEYFARSQWIDTPARMLAPMIVDVLAANGSFQAVAPATSAAAGDLRLTSEIVRLEHDFTTPAGQLRFTLRATVLDNATRKVLAWREFDEVVVPDSGSAYDGIVAANRAVQLGLKDLSGFCADVVQQWQSTRKVEQVDVSLKK
ncbi:cholesterol transport system auxiliary component [Oxalobacteraceae bacterium GrIS 2.11]